MALSFAGFWKRKWWAVGLELDWRSIFGLTVSSSLSTFIHNQCHTEALQIYKELEFYTPPPHTLCICLSDVFGISLFVRNRMFNSDRMFYFFNQKYSKDNHSDIISI